MCSPGLLTQDAAQGDHMDLEVALLDEGVGPHLGEQIALGHHRSGALDQGRQQPQRPIADPHRRLVLQEQLPFGQQQERTEGEGSRHQFGVVVRHSRLRAAKSPHRPTLSDI